MKTVVLEIKPLSSFATIPKGDTLFGQILAYLFLDKSKNKEILESFDDYFKENKKPPFIVSDMMPYGYVYKPTLPLECFKSLNRDEIDKKALRKKEFISIENLQKGDLHLCQKVDYFDEVAEVKNSINRATFTTGEENFAPYGTVERQYFRKLWLFLLVEGSIKDKIIKTVENIGRFGFGKDANSGKGSFDVNEIDCSIDYSVDTPYYLSISPTILKDSNIDYSWYNPFTRFGKFGLHNAFNNAFKKPVLMADSSAVVKLKEKKRYFGIALNNGTEDKVSHLQGYSIAIPFKIKDEKCLNTD
jgi:CRISPR-associated protein Csm4